MVVNDQPPTASEAKAGNGSLIDPMSKGKLSKITHLSQKFPAENSQIPEKSVKVLRITDASVTYLAIT